MTNNLLQFSNHLKIITYKSKKELKIFKMKLEKISFLKMKNIASLENRWKNWRA
jgi:hypothetical protein